MTYNLITPNNKIIDQYNKFWDSYKGTPISEKEWFVELFEKEPKLVDIRDYISENEFKEYGTNDYKIREFWNNKDYKLFLDRINSTYHTRVDVSKLDFLDKKWIEKHGIDDFVEKCKSLIHKNPYSFATKVYSFVYQDQDKYPIMDSLVSTLLWYYMKDECKKKNNPKSSWGYYNKYIKAYEDFKDKYHIERTYKQIDIFMWTYANVISSYWKNQGVLSFTPVEYKGKY